MTCVKKNCEIAAQGLEQHMEASNTGMKKRTIVYNVANSKHVQRVYEARTANARSYAATGDVC